MKFLFAAFAMLLAQGPQETGKASIEGVIVHTVTGKPVEGVRVVLTKDTPVVSTGELLTSLSGTDAVKATGTGTLNIRPPIPPAVPPVASDEKGKFSFRGLDPGRYRLTFSRNGYVRQQHGQRGLSGQGTSFYLAAGQTLNDLKIRLTPTGTISGRVLNEGNQPMARVPVDLVRNSYNSIGQKILQNVMSTMTDDRGEYRLAFITPGRYFLGAGTRSSLSSELLITLRWTSPNEFAEASAHLFYPGVLDINNATAIDVSMGAEIGGFDFHLGKQQKFRLRGRVVDASGSPPANASLGITYTVSGATGGFNFGGNYKAEDGTFEFKDILPGIYGILERGGAVANERNIAERPTERPGTAVQVSVINADVDGIVLAVPPVASLSGRLTVDGRNYSAIPELEKLRVRLPPPIDTPAYYAVNNFVAPTPATLDMDGGFKLDNVAPGEYRVTILGMPPGYFIKEARYGGADVLNQPFRFDSSQRAQLEIVISPNSGQLTGVVLDEKRQPASGVQAVLIPDRGRNRAELYKTAITDEAGRFTMTGIPTGDYKLFAWEAIEPNFWFDPDVVQRSEPRAQAVHIYELSKETVEARIIPATP
jgi:protocatechuate 3,4-dioxygenase beta subunit